MGFSSLITEITSKFNNDYQLKDVIILTVIFLVMRFCTETKP